MTRSALPQQTGGVEPTVAYQHRIDLRNKPCPDLRASVWIYICACACTCVQVRTNQTSTSIYAVTMSSTRPLLTRSDEDILVRVHEAIKDTVQTDKLALIRDEILRKGDTYAAFISALDTILEANNIECDDTEWNIWKQLVKDLDEKHESAGAQDKKKRWWKPHTERVMFIAMQWSLEVVKHYGWDEEEYGTPTMKALKQCAQKWPRFKEDFVPQANVIRWLRHRHAVSLGNAAQEFQYAGKLQFKDLEPLLKLDGKTPVEVYGKKVTLGTAKALQPEIEKWTENQDGVLTVKGKQVDLKILRCNHWNMLLLKYDKNGWLVRRENSDKADTPRRTGILSPPASTLVPTGRPDRLEIVTDAFDVHRSTDSTTSSTPAPTWGGLDLSRGLAGCDIRKPDSTDMGDTGSWRSGIGTLVGTPLGSAGPKLSEEGSAVEEVSRGYSGPSVTQIFLTDDDYDDGSSVLSSVPDIIEDCVAQASAFREVLPGGETVVQEDSTTKTRQQDPTTKTRQQDPASQDHTEPNAESQSSTELAVTPDHEVHMGSPMEDLDEHNGQRCVSTHAVVADDPVADSTSLDGVKSWLSGQDQQGGSYVAASLNAASNDTPVCREASISWPDEAMHDFSGDGGAVMDEMIGRMKNHHVAGQNEGVSPGDRSPTALPVRELRRVSTSTPSLNAQHVRKTPSIAGDSSSSAARSLPASFSTASSSTGGKDATSFARRPPSFCSEFSSDSDGMAYTARSQSASSEPFSDRSDATVMRDRNSPPWSSTDSTDFSSRSSDMGSPCSVDYYFEEGPDFNPRNRGPMLGLPQMKRRPNQTPPTIFDQYFPPAYMENGGSGKPSHRSLGHRLEDPHSFHHQLSGHRGLRPQDCACQVCDDLTPLLERIHSEALLPGASLSHRARRSWFANARWTSVVEGRDVKAPGRQHDAEVLSVGPNSFKKMADEGVLLERPIVIHERATDEGIFDFNMVRKMLRDSHGDDTVTITNNLAQEPETVGMEEFLMRVSGNESPISSSTPRDLFGPAIKPAFLSHHRFRLLHNATTREMHRRTKTSSGNTRCRDVDHSTYVNGGLSFCRIETSGAFCGPCVSPLGGMWLRNLMGWRLCAFVPRAMMTADMYLDFARKTLEWLPQDCLRLVLLKPNDVLILPPGIVCAQLAVNGPSVSLEGAYWDELEAGRYFTAMEWAAMNPTCPMQIPQCARPFAWKGLQSIARENPQRFASDPFIRELFEKDNPDAPETSMAMECSTDGRPADRHVQSQETLKRQDCCPTSGSREGDELPAKRRCM